MSDFILNKIYVPALDMSDAILEIEQGNWFSSPMAAEATADQMSFELGRPYKVYKITLEEM